MSHNTTNIVFVVYSKHGEVPPLPGPKLNIVRKLFWNWMTLAAFIKSHRAPFLLNEVTINPLTEEL